MKLSIVSLSVIALATVLMAFGSRWYVNNLHPVDLRDDSQQYVEIEPGMSSVQIARLLEEKELIRDDIAFRLYLRLQRSSSKIQAGFYALQPDFSATTIARILTEGKTVSKIITITGGTELSKISDILVEAGFSEQTVKTAFRKSYDLDILKDKPRAASLEGYLFPDTYHTDLDATVEEVITMMLVNTEEKITPQIREEWRKRGLNVHQGLTLASIVQKEMPTSEEQAKAAQVFLKRLDNSIKLEADPTFIYAAKLEGVTPSVSLNSPYNTYKVRGLPPTPIGSSELSAIRAVAFPSSTDFLYFVTGADGVTRFSNTQADHDAIIEKFGVSGIN